MNCIAYPNYPLGYSETFIKAHLDNIDWDYRMCHSWYPYREAKTGKPFLGFPFQSIWTNGLFRRISIAQYEKVYTFRLAQYLKKNNIKVLLTEYGLTGANMAEACLQADTKLVVHFHGADAYHFKTLEQYHKKYKKMFANCHKIIVVSQAMKKQLVGLGADSSKVFYNSYGIDDALFTPTNPAKNPPNFVAIGRFIPKKAPVITLQAFAKVLQYVPTARLQMIGDGALFEAAQQTAQALGIVSQVDFLGVLSPDQVHKTLQNARAFVQHSVTAPDGDSEGMPNAVLEASMCALPTVSTRHAGICDAVIEQETGFLGNEYDIDAMAQGMVLLAQQPDLAQKMGEKARLHISQHFSSEKSINNLKKIIFE
jgi:glycosyltransferase involved in cell wall biosynthesis